MMQIKGYSNYGYEDALSFAIRNIVSKKKFIKTN